MSVVGRAWSAAGRTNEVLEGVEALLDFSNRYLEEGGDYGTMDEKRQNIGYLVAFSDKVEEYNNDPAAFYEHLYYYHIMVKMTETAEAP